MGSFFHEAAYVDDRSDQSGLLSADGITYEISGPFNTADTGSENAIGRSKRKTPPDPAGPAAADRRQPTAGTPTLPAHNMLPPRHHAPR